jgi:hypothetical protein
MSRHPLLHIVLIPLALTLAITGAANAQAEAGTAPGIAGVYRCVGSNGDGSPYQGFVKIEKHGDAYHVWWALEPGVYSVGIGIRQGTTLAVSYYGGTTGVIAYRIDGERLVGDWTIPGGNGVLASETLTPLAEGEEPILQGPQQPPGPAAPQIGIRL